MRSTTSGSEGQEVGVVEAEAGVLHLPLRVLHQDLVQPRQVRGEDAQAVLLVNIAGHVLPVVPGLVDHHRRRALGVHQDGDAVIGPVREGDHRTPVPQGRLQQGEGCPGPFQEALHGQAEGAHRVLHQGHAGADPQPSQQVLWYLSLAHLGPSPGRDYRPCPLRGEELARPAAGTGAGTRVELKGEEEGSMDRQTAHGPGAGPDRPDQPDRPAPAVPDAPAGPGAATGPGGAPDPAALRGTRFEFGGRRPLSVPPPRVTYRPPQRPLPGLGTVALGKVTRVAPYGAFVDFLGFRGLVHISQLQPGHRVERVEDVVLEGHQVVVRVIAVDPERRHINLALVPDAAGIMETVQEGPQAVGASQEPAPPVVASAPDSPAAPAPRAPAEAPAASQSPPPRPVSAPVAPAPSPPVPQAPPVPPVPRRLLRLARRRRRRARHRRPPARCRRSSASRCRSTPHGPCTGR